MNIILLGAPGSGKGTQAQILVKKHGFTQLSTGDLFRKHIANNTKLGIEAKRYMNEGHLVPDSVTNDMVWDYLQNEQNDGLIFDGYPRTVNQARALDEMLSKLHRKIDHIFKIDVRPTILVERISNRWVCPTCKTVYGSGTNEPKQVGICDHDQTKLIRRPDDAPDKVQVRLEVYNKDNAPLVDYYEAKGLIVVIDGENPNPEVVYATINKHLT